MNEQSLAYDLSIYETSEERYVERRSNQKKENKIIKATTKFSLGRSITNILGVALVLSLVIGVIATNAAVTRYTADITSVKSEIVQLESQQDYLNFTLESRMTLDEIENYATGTLGMVKMEPSQRKYVELEGENKIVMNDTSVTSKINKAIQPVLSYLLP